MPLHLGYRRRTRYKSVACPFKPHKIRCPRFSTILFCKTFESPPKPDDKCARPPPTSLSDKQSPPANNPHSRCASDNFTPLPHSSHARFIDKRPLDAKAPSRRPLAPTVLSIVPSATTSDACRRDSHSKRPDLRWPTQTASVTQLQSFVTPLGRP